MDLGGNGVEIPALLKLVMIFVDRVGFPILAFVLMFTLSFWGLNKVSTTMDKNTVAITEMCCTQRLSAEAIIGNQHMIIDNQRVIQGDIKDILSKK